MVPNLLVQVPSRGGGEEKILQEGGDLSDLNRPETKDRNWQAEDRIRNHIKLDKLGHFHNKGAESPTGSGKPQRGKSQDVGFGKRGNEHSQVLQKKGERKADSRHFLSRT